MKKIMTLCLAVGLMAGLAVNASAADYEFSTGDSTEYYGSTNYEDQYDSAYRYGETNQIDFDIPEIEYGLAQEFLESSLSNPYLTPGHPIWIARRQRWVPGNQYREWQRFRRQLD